ncbi:MAG: SLC13 family permease [Pseudomonadota bacterium]|nr:SLC13 family permease [Pseudomonadota bacterium]
MTPAGRVGIVVGPALFVAVAFGPMPEVLAGPPQRALGVMALCMVWWLTSPVALPITSLLGMALLPLLGVLDKNEAVALFGNQAVFFVIAAFIIAAVTIRTGLSTRITLWALRRLARSEDVLCGAILLVATLLTAVVVSHAVAALLLPIMMETLRALGLEPGSRFARRMLLSMAWGTICGSNLTLLSSARASLAVGIYESWNTTHAVVAAPIGFFEYSSATAWIAVFTAVAGYFLLRWAHKPEGLDMAPALQRLAEKAAALGPVSLREWFTAATIGFMVVALVLFGPTYGLGTLALCAAAVLFVAQIIQWEDAENFVNWGVALLYGGAIAVAAALEKTHAIEIIVETWLPVGGLTPFAFVLIVSVAAAVLTEFVSNAAVIALFLPMCLALAPQVGLDGRALVFLLPAAAGLAYAFPMSTPAMAMVFGTGYLRTQDSLVPGVTLTLLGSVGMVGIVYWVWPLMGISAFLGAP